MTNDPIRILVITALPAQAIFLRACGNADGNITVCGAAADLPQ
jgi:hypothetical protein